MKPGLIRSTGLLLALALHAAVLAPYWLAPRTLQGGSGGPVSSGRTLNLSLTEVRETRSETQPEPRPEAKPEPEPEPQALKTEHKPEEKDEPKEKEKAKKTEPEQQQTTRETEESETVEEIQPLPEKTPAGDGREAGPGAHNQGERDNAWNRYLGEIQRAIEQRKTYPRRARLRRQEGVVRVRFSVDEEGRVATVTLEESSGSNLLDRHVQRLLRDANLPAPPQEVDVTEREITLPVQFRLR